MIKESFIQCALSIDGSRDYLIHYFKEGQPCCEGREVLRLQLMILQDEENPFENHLSLMLRKLMDLVSRLVKMKEMTRTVIFYE